MIGSMTLPGSDLSPLRWLKRAPTVLLRSGVFATGLVVLGFGLEAQATYSDLQAVAPPLDGAQAQATESTPSFPAPGQYLFGQSPQADQVGSGYIVLESDGQAIHGALYFPGSSFDCFQGHVEGNAMAMTILDSYSQETYPYSIALVPQGSAIAADQITDGLTPLSLSGFYTLDQITANDLRMLGVCQAAMTAGE